jgi:geranylgeranyl reductase
MNERDNHINYFNTQENILSMEKYKSIIIGGGPGGLRCAKILAENDEDFLLIERENKPSSKVCTGMWGITEKTKYMGLPNSVFERKYKSVLFTKPKRTVEVKLDNHCVATLNRRELNRWLYKEADKSGANMVFGSNVTKIGNNYIVSEGKKTYFENLIGADGSLSIVRDKLGLPRSVGIGVQYWLNKRMRNMEIHFDADRFGPWCSWIAPHNKVTSIGTGGDMRLNPPSQMKRNLDSWCSENKIDISNARFEGAPINHIYLGHKFDNIFLIGDAAGFTSGLTGGGIYFSMASGEDIARMIIDSKHEPKLISKILDIKKKHERILYFLRLNKNLEKVGYNLLLYLLRFKFFDHKLLELIG